MVTSNQSKHPFPHDSQAMAAVDEDQYVVSSDSPSDLEAEHHADEQASTESAGKVGEAEAEDRAARRKRHVRMFCFSCNRYEGHSIAAKSRILYSFLVGFTFGLYYYLGRYSCHCCGTVRLARRDWLNPRFWYRNMWLGSVAKPKKSKSKSRSRR